MDTLTLIKKGDRLVMIDDVMPPPGMGKKARIEWILRPAGRLGNTLFREMNLLPVEPAEARLRELPL